MLATGFGDRTAQLWDAATGEPRATLTGHKDGVTSGLFAASDRELVTACTDTTIKLGTSPRAQSA